MEKRSKHVGRAGEVNGGGWGLEEPRTRRNLNNDDMMTRTRRDGDDDERRTLGN